MPTGHQTGLRSLGLTAWHSAGSPCFMRGSRSRRDRSWRTLWQRLKDSVTAVFQGRREPALSMKPAAQVRPAPRGIQPLALAPAARPRSRSGLALRPTEPRSELQIQSDAPALEGAVVAPGTATVMALDIESWLLGDDPAEAQTAACTPQEIAQEYARHVGSKLAEDLAQDVKPPTPNGSAKPRHTVMDRPRR